YSGVQAIQTTKVTRMHFLVDFRRSSPLPKLRESLALEAPDHSSGVCKRLVYFCQQVAYLHTGLMRACRITHDCTSIFALWHVCRSLMAPRSSRSIHR